MIEGSRWIYALPDNFDGEGSTEYKRETWERAVRFAELQVQGMGASCPLPTIEPGPEGSIDVHWKTSTFELLVNVPPKGVTADFYGDDFGSSKLQGTLEITGFNQRLAFLLGDA